MAWKSESGQGLLPARNLFLLLLMGGLPLSRASMSHIMFINSSILSGCGWSILCIRTLDDFYFGFPQATKVRSLRRTKWPLDFCVSELAFLPCYRGGCCNLFCCCSKVTTTVAIYLCRCSSSVEESRKHCYNLDLCKPLGVRLSLTCIQICRSKPWSFSAWLSSSCFVCSISSVRQSVADRGHQSSGLYSFCALYYYIGFVILFIMEHRPHSLEERGRAHLQMILFCKMSLYSQYEVVEKCLV